jgi:DNA helicase-2/ATP-dependent DNA helicase PcrA
MSELNNAQKDAVSYIDAPLLIVAGAGTGKTTVITEKIAYLIQNKLAAPEEILALTFTDKAAGELMERVDARLSLGYVELAISTFHTFCERLLSEYALDIGLPRQFKLITDTDAWLLLRAHIYDIGLKYYRPVGNPASVSVINLN